MPNEPALVDANVLVYAFYAEEERHAASRRLVDTAIEHGARLCLTSQVLAEFFSVITNPKRVTLARTPEDAIAAIELILALPGVSVLPTPRDLAQRWIALLRRHLVSGARVFDLQLIATMQANGVNSIYTYNRGDFAAFSEINVVTPSL
jgi:toxin-antitoxin system PIN domain toxin